MSPASTHFLDDRALMKRAMTLAERAVGLSGPNPRVGCVIVGQDGLVLGEGHTQQAGGPHAEVMALRSVASSGHTAFGTTAFVTLEPCSHHGRTPPCCDALIAAGLARVVVAVVDPNPLVGGAGIERLRAAGVQVDIGFCAEESRELNVGFFSRMQRGMPWVRMKVASSIDGRTALDNGVSQWITGSAARTDGHAWRKRAGATLTGIGTILEDNPRLDVRLVESARQPLRVVVDSRLETPLSARILSAPGHALVYAACPDESRESALRDKGAEVAYWPGSKSKVDLAAALRDLAVRGINEVHVEAGQKLNGSLIRERLVDEFLFYVAPKLIGAGRDIAAFGPLQRLDEALELQFHAVDRVGSDLRIVARPTTVDATA